MRRSWGLMLACLLASSLAGCTDGIDAPGADIPMADPSAPVERGACSLAVSGTGGTSGVSYLQGADCFLADIGPMNLTNVHHLAIVAEWPALQPTATGRVVAKLQNETCMADDCVLAQAGGMRSPLAFEADGNWTAAGSLRGLVVRLAVDGIVFDQPFTVRVAMSE